MEWKLAHPMYDVADIVWMSDTFFGTEADGILKRNKAVFTKNVTIAATVQLFDKNREFLAVCRTPDERLLGFCWYDRGGYTTYANEEISNAKFHHVDLTLPAKTRVKLVHQMIDQHILWANACGIPVIGNDIGGVKESISSNKSGFLVKNKEECLSVILNRKYKLLSVKGIIENSKNKNIVDFTENILSKFNNV